MTWIDSVKEATCMSLQELSTAIEDRAGQSTVDTAHLQCCQELEPTQDT